MDRRQPAKKNKGGQSKDRPSRAGPRRGRDVPKGVYGDKDLMDSYVKAMAQMKDAFEIGYKDTYQLRTDFETKKRMTREQITDPKLIDKLNTYRRKTGEFGFQNFKFEPGTGNWFREKDLKEDDFRF